MSNIRQSKSYLLYLTKSRSYKKFTGAPDLSEGGMNRIWDSYCTPQTKQVSVLQVAEIESQQWSSHIVNGLTKTFKFRETWTQALPATTHVPVLQLLACRSTCVVCWFQVGRMCWRQLHCACQSRSPKWICEPVFAVYLRRLLSILRHFCRSGSVHSLSWSPTPVHKIVVKIRYTFLLATAWSARRSLFILQRILEIVFGNDFSPFGMQLSSHAMDVQQFE